MDRHVLRGIVVFAVGILLFALAVNASENEGQSIVVPVLHNCVPANGQVCGSNFTFGFIAADDAAQITFMVSPSHCSSIKVELFVNGASQGESPFLRWPGEPSLPNTFTWNVRLNDEGSAANVIELRATGRLGGCNQGVLASWGGTLVILVDPEDAD